MAALAAVYLGVGFSIDEGHGAPTFIIGALAALFLTEFGVRGGIPRRGACTCVGTGWTLCHASRWSAACVPCASSDSCV